MKMRSSLVLAFALQACVPSTSGTDSSMDPDGALDDVGGEAGDTVDGAADDAYTSVDAGADTAFDLDAGVEDDAAICDYCFPPTECIIATGCAPECAYTGRPDGTRCSDNHGSCSDGFCIRDTVGCGDGTRQLTPDREGCDDGNVDPMDACSPTCEPTPIVIASHPGESDRPRTQAPAMAVDGAGFILFVWLGTVSPPGTDAHRQLRARRYTSTGVAQGDVLTLEDDIGISQPVQPSVAGQASGWVVTWRSTAVEGGAGEQGGIAYRSIAHDGALRPTRRANTTVLSDQLDPTVVALSTGFVIVWTDMSSELVTGDLRMREMDPFGNPISSELPVTTTTADDQSHAVSAARGSAMSLGTQWALAFTDESDPSLEPRVRMRRFDRTAPADATDFLVAHSWSSEPTIAMTSTDTLVGWTGRATDAHGDVFVRRVADLVVPTDDADVDAPFASMASTGMPSPVDELASVAPFPADGSQGYVVAWHTDSRAMGGPGVRFAASSGVTPPPESATLSSYFLPAESNLTLAATDLGLWVGWSDASMVGVPDAFVAYLLPWD